jgi:hypothetical protein
MNRSASVLLLAVACVASIALAAASEASAYSTSFTATAPCAVFTGSVEWNDQSVPEVAIFGKLRYTCSTGYTTVWLSWTTGRWWTTQHHNAKDGTAWPEHPTTNVSVIHAYGQGNPSHIGVAVCSGYHGWHCGTSFHT